MDVLQYLIIGFRVKTIFMSIFVVDYKEKTKELISDLYESADFLNKEFEFTTEQLTCSLQRVLPYNSIDDHLVYESLIELGFKPQEKPKEPLSFSWYFKRKL